MLPGRFYPMIAEQNAPRLVRLLPVAVLATLLVAGAPILAVWAVRVTGLVSSSVLATALGVVLSLAGSCLGGLWWERRRRSRDVLFGDLMIWGWLRRYMIERRLTSAVELLGLPRGRAAGRELRLGTEQFSAERQAKALEQLAASLEARDLHTHGHSRRVARYATMIAKRMGLAKGEVARIRAAAAIHDVGKIETPIALLHKSGRLTEAEFEVIKRHAVDGARMVARVGDHELTAIVRHHHERLDGTGYPDGLSGARIPLGARIIAVADTFDAITSERPYRPAKAHKVAIEILRREAGEQLDPDAVHAFRSVYFGKRSLGAWIGATNVLEGLASWLGAGAVGSTARVAVIAASTAALGAGAVALPDSAARASTRPRARRPPEAARASASPGTEARDLAVPHVSSAAHRARLVHGVGERVVGSPVSAVAAGPSAPAAGAGSNAGAGAGAGSGTDSGSAGGGGGSVGGGGTAGGTGAGTGTTVAAVSVAGAPSVGVTVSSGAPGALPSVAVTVGGSTAASVGGTSGGGVGANVGGAKAMLHRVDKALKRHRS